VSDATFRTPLGPRLLTLVAVLVCGAASICMLGFVVICLLAKQWSLAVLILAVAWLLASLTGYVVRDLRGKWRLRVTMDPDALVLDLPAGRSLIHKAPTQQLRIPYAEIEAIETRLEAYRTLGMAMLQRAYVLHRKDGELIYLFEDRALDTLYETSFFTRLANDVASRAGVPVRDLGMTEGGGGVLGVWGTRAADWAAPALSLGRQRRIRRDVAFTGTLSIVLVILALVLRLLLG
jgi:hypothetical protein